MKHIHFMGIGGSGISGVAKLASKIGYEVTGCDLEGSTAYAQNIYKGHSVDHIKDVDLVVVSPAVFYQSSTNPEVVEAKKRGILMTWQEFLGKYLHKGKKVVCITGTHGKSTTTAMAIKLLEDAGLDPSATIGAKLQSTGENYRFGKGDYFVTEADEFYDNFLHYHPEVIILNNIEFDHPDYFSSEEKVFESFKKFIKNLTGQKILIANEDFSVVMKLLKSIDTKNVKVVLYSVKERNIDFKLKIPGKHNIQNALGVEKLGEVLGIDKKTVKKSLESFLGIGRRLELLNKDAKVKVYDDYAHHPTAIAATLEALRSLHPKSRIWTIVEAHGYKRTKALLNLYKGVFKDADDVLIGPIFKARDSETFGMTPHLLAKKTYHKNAKGFDSFDDIKRVIQSEARAGDVVLVMGAGDSYLWARELSKLFKEVSFKNLTTFRVGGKIKHYRQVKNRKELISAVSFASQNNLPIFVLGGGSDILVSDKPFDGVVIKFVGSKYRVSNIESRFLITVEAGMDWDDFVEWAVENNLQGMECLSGIPGTVGAAPIQNIGAYGQELKDTFVSLTAYDIDRQKFVKFSKADCEFSYRESIFKRAENWQKFIITDVTFSLKKNGKPEIKYDSLKNYLKEKNIENPTLRNIRDAVLAVRASKFENPKDVGNAGSFFKNPVIDAQLAGKLMKKYPDIVLRDQGNTTYKGSAGWFIEMCGWKGKTYKNAAVSSNHALVLINPKGNAKASDIMELSEKIIADVYKKFGVRLEREVQLINFNKKVAILGYGIEGQDAEKYLKSHGADIIVLDRKFDENYLKNLNSFDVVVRSPGVYRYLPGIIQAEKRGTLITSAIKIFFENCPAKIIGVTGTKGKGTTSTLVYQILKSAGEDVYLAGNIGKPYLELLPKLNKDSWVILEMSSFQLIDMKVSPNIAVVLNITIDHLDWHKDREEYVNAKKNIVRYQSAFDWAVINGQYETPKSFAKLTKAKVVFFSKKSLDKKYRENILLKGEHNLENIAAAVTVGKILKIDDKIIIEVLKSFKGLEHRLELVAEINRRTFYNDSFATGPQPTIAAVRSFEEPTTVILGGSDKNLDFAELGEVISKRKSVECVVLIGTVAEKIKTALKNADFNGKVIEMGKKSMEKIVQEAFSNTPKGGVVLLSPATASFDMFKNYKDRGEQFKKAVKELV